MTASDLYTTHKLSIALDCSISEFLEFLDKWDSKIIDHITVGPVGGNPEFSILTPKAKLPGLLADFWHLKP